jgi:hypothetical protein
MYHSVGVYTPIKVFLVATAFLMTSAANASTIFAPTSGDVNFLNINIDLSANTLVAMFNVDDLGGMNNAVILSSDYESSVAVFSSSTGDFAVDVKDVPPPSTGTTYDTMTLLGSDNFILGLSTDSGDNWVADTGYTDKSGGFYDVHFANGDILQVDVQVVPVPPAVWLFGSGLIGLVGIARRKNSV